MLPHPHGTLRREDDPNMIWVRFDRKEWDEYYNTLESPKPSGRRWIRGRRWSLFLAVVLQYAALFSVLWEPLRGLMFPDGTTPALALVLALLFIIWEEVLRMRKEV